MYEHWCAINNCWRMDSHGLNVSPPQIHMLKSNQTPTVLVFGNGTFEN